MFARWLWRPQPQVVLTALVRSPRVALCTPPQFNAPFSPVIRKRQNNAPPVPSTWKTSKQWREKARCNLCFKKIIDKSKSETFWDFSDNRKLRGAPGIYENLVIHIKLPLGELVIYLRKYKWEEWADCSLIAISWVPITGQEWFGVT